MQNSENSFAPSSVVELLTRQRNEWRVLHTELIETKAPVQQVDFALAQILYFQISIDNANAKRL